jgi:hypothetical protein
VKGGLLMAEMPTIAAAAHSHSTYAGLPTMGGNGGWAGANQGGGGGLGIGGIDVTGVGALSTTSYYHKPVMSGGKPTIFAEAIDKIPDSILAEVNMPTRRLVQVFIADPDERVPLGQSMIYSGEQKLTDLTDQELFFEVDIKSLLGLHNAKRTQIIDKSVKDRSEFLEPVKIRDLKMVVTTIAQF